MCVAGSPDAFSTFQSALARRAGDITYPGCRGASRWERPRRNPAATSSAGVGFISGSAAQRGMGSSSLCVPVCMHQQCSGGTPRCSPCTKLLKSAAFQSCFCFVFETEAPRRTTALRLEECALASVSKSRLQSQTKRRGNSPRRGCRHRKTSRCSPPACAPAATCKTGCATLIISCIWTTAQA